MKTEFTLSKVQNSAFPPADLFINRFLVLMESSYFAGQLARSWTPRIIRVSLMILSVLAKLTLNLAIALITITWIGIVIYGGRAVLWMHDVGLPAIVRALDVGIGFVLCYQEQ